MSKTDKTRPQWVKASDHPALLEEEHDHSQGLPCDLPPRPLLWGAGEKTRCVWVMSQVAIFRGEVGRCGCAFCSGRHWRREESRRERRQGRRYARSAWKSEYGA